ncbi:MAG TPA: HD domain-containing protein [Ferruginibacter sp.]|nr:HD domain-containing protein [Ferruginibacter sp.]
MPTIAFEKLYEHVMEMLQDLDPSLTYHSIHHTRDVVRQSERIAKEEGIPPDQIVLLKIAALYHDTGFLKVYAGHEEAGCAIFEADKYRSHFSDDEAALILGLIRATKVPQQPHTHLQQIICDADLDYLGRTDFPPIAALLQKEVLHAGLVPDALTWHEREIQFLQKHRYHTHSSQTVREPVKQQNIEALLRRS